MAELLTGGVGTSGSESVDDSTGATITNTTELPAQLIVSNDGAATVRFLSSTSGTGGIAVETGVQGVLIASFQPGATVPMISDSGTCTVKYTWAPIGSIPR